jgi:spermidine/putrescine transport system substrate-binding protein
MSDQTAHLDPAFLRGLARGRMGRRDALRLAGLSAAGLTLAACGVKGKGIGSSTVTPQQIREFWTGQTRQGHMTFANWPLYMDPERPELKQFTRKTGIRVDYKEAVQDIPEFFGKIQPQLAAGKSIGYDLMVITNGVQFTELVQLGYVAPLDHSKLPNFAQYAGAKYKQASYDPANAYSVPWTSGITGIVYNPEYVTTPPTRIADLWDPKYKGKVGMFSDTQEIGGFGLMLDGVNPERSTPADWKRAAARLKAQRDGGIVRKYFQQDYIKPVTSGDIWLGMGWSGDVFQQNVSEGSNLKFVIPEEGGLLWTDNMMIPKTAQSPLDALTLMDFFYDPKVAASLAEYINYITPVPSAKDAILADAKDATGEDKTLLEALATSPMVFPSDADYARLHRYRAMTTAQERQQYESIFQPVVQS